MIVVDGNDGTGKTTLVEALRSMGYLVQDRGMPTWATENGIPADLPSGEVYLILDAPPEICHLRIVRAGRDPHEKYHTLTDLTDYRRRFCQIAERLGVPLINAALSAEKVLQQALKLLGTSGPLKVGIPKGRLSGGVSETLRLCGYDISPPQERQLKVSSGATDFYLVKPRSIPQLVALGYLDAGFCGKDLVAESGCEDYLRTALDLKCNRIELCAAAADPDIVRNPPPRPLAIATEYPRLASRWAYTHNLAHLCLQTWGSTEAWVPELADVAVDVVESGRTLQANGLTRLDIILTGTTVLVERKDRPVLIHTVLGKALGIEQ